VTYQYLTPIKLGYRDERIYPLRGPDLATAKALARGRTRNGKAVLYVSTVPAPLAQAEIIRANLKQIGIEVEVKAFPTATLLFEKLSTPGERLLEEASRLTGDERYRAFGDLDVQISRDVAPAIPYSYDNTLTLVGARTGCVIVNPYLDLAAVCLK
jgi:ABC-type transport system substrate-binding protein